MGVRGCNLGHSDWPLEGLFTITAHPVLRVEQSCTGHQRWDGWISGAHQASAVQSHSQCDLILLNTQLQGEGWTRDSRVPSSVHLRVPQSALLEESLLFEVPLHVEDKKFLVLNKWQKIEVCYLLRLVHSTIKELFITNSGFGCSRTLQSISCFMPGTFLATSRWWKGK